MARSPPIPPNQPPSPRPKKRNRGGSAIDKAISALNSLIRMRGSPDYFMAFRAELSGSGTERGIAILLATGVEDALQSAIETQLDVHGDMYEKLFGINAPVGTFENKIRIGFALRIFGQETMQNQVLAGFDP